MNKNILNKKVLQIVSQIAQLLQKKKLLKSQEKIVLTTSGGQDSICLLVIFFLLRTQLLDSFDLLFCHHFWQRSSFFTMLHVAKCTFCCSTNIMFFLPLNQLTSEKAGRDWRHKVIQRTMIFYGYDTATQAHTKSDRVETLLFNLIRGAGLAGVSTLQFQCIQSLFSYNKFYPVKFLSTEKIFEKPIQQSLHKKQYFAPYFAQIGLLTNSKQYFSTDFNTLPKKRLHLCKNRKVEINDMCFQTSVKVRFYKVNKKYTLTEIKNINFLLKCLNYLSLSIGLQNESLHSLYFIKVSSKSLLWYKYEVKLQYIYESLSLYTLPLFHTILYTYLYRDQFEFYFFTIIRNKKIFQLVNQSNNRKTKVSFFRLAFSQRLDFNDFYFNFRLIEKTKKNTSVVNKWFNKFENKSEIKTHKTYYNQLKRLSDVFTVVS